MVSTTYIFSIKIGRGFSEKSHFFDFFFSLNNSQKNAI